MHKPNYFSPPDLPPIVILGVPFDNVSASQTVCLVEEMIASGHPHHLATANVDFLVQSLRDIELHRILMDAHLVLCDGMPLVWASRMLGNSLPERVAGADLVPLLIRIAAEKGYRVFFLGGAPESTCAAVANVQAQFPKLNICGWYSPPFTDLLEMDHEAIRCRIQQAKPDLLFVSFGCPKQEKWIAMQYRSLGVPVCVGVGATVDFLAGRAKRAPIWMRRCGIEWLFRLLQEPRRLFKRYLLDFFVFSRAIVEQWWRMQVLGGPGELAQNMPQIHLKKWKRVRLPERLDKATVRRDEILCAEALANSRQCLLDLSAVRTVDSTGIGLLIRLQKQSRIANRKLILFAPSAAVQSALKLMRLEPFFCIAHDITGIKRLLDRQLADRPVMLQPNYFPSKPSIFWQGEITASNAEQVWRCTQTYISARSETESHLLIDLSGLRFVDSTGVGLMVRAKKHAMQQGLDLLFTGTTPTVRNVLQFAQVERFVLGV